MDARRRTQPLLFLLSLMLACAKAGGPADPAAARGGAAAVDAIAQDLWRELVRHSPLWATANGDRSLDAELDDPSEAEAKRHVAALRALQARLDELDPSALPDHARVSAAALTETIDARADAIEACRPLTWQVDPLYGYPVQLAQLATNQTIASREDAAELETRYRKTKGFLEAHVASLRAGLAEGYLAPKPIVERMIAQLDGQLSVAAAESPHAQAKLPALWDAAEAARVRASLADAVRDGVYPGLAALRDFLRKELLPKARVAPGVSSNPGGAACYAAMIRRETGTSKTPRELHELGLSRVKAIEAEMAAIAKAAGAASAREYLAALAADPEQGFASREAIVEHNERFVEKARGALAKAFKVLPKTPLEVRPVEAYREKAASRGAYHQAPPDGSRPAIYYVNTIDPPSQLAFTMASLAAHESLPGHHLQIALAQENEKLPRFQRDMPPNAYVEGWGLYSERLADELGLYAGDRERMGMLDAQRLRAVRLVVDSGLHGLGWTREQAIAYQLEHGQLTRAQAERAIDRYITWPGQALGYMVGQLEIQSIRADAEKALGDRFDLAAFHEQFLAHGGVPLPVIRREIETWTASRR